MKPTHVLKVFDKVTEGRTTVGCGWLNRDGSIGIQLNPCVVLSRKADLVFTLFPVDDEMPEPTTRKKTR